MKKALLPSTLTPRDKRLKRERITDKLTLLEQKLVLLDCVTFANCQPQYYAHANTELDGTYSIQVRVKRPKHLQVYSGPTYRKNQIASVMKQIVESYYLPMHTTLRYSDVEIIYTFTLGEIV